MQADCDEPLPQRRWWIHLAHGRTGKAPPRVAASHGYRGQLVPFFLVRQEQLGQFLNESTFSHATLCDEPLQSSHNDVGPFLHDALRSFLGRLVHSRHSVQACPPGDLLACPRRRRKHTTDAKELLVTPTFLASNQVTICVGFVLFPSKVF